MGLKKHTTDKAGVASSDDAMLEKLRDELVGFLKPSDDLDDAAARLPQLFYKVADTYADASNAETAASDAYDDAYAQAEERAWKAEDDKRMTVARVKSIAEADVFVVKAKRRLRHCTAAVKKIDALLKAYQQKASMLKAQVELVASQYAQKDTIRPRTRKF
jgi:hypothetical protein